MIAANAPAPASASAPAPAPSASATSAQHSPLSVVVILPDSLSACAPEQRFVAAALQLQGSLSADSSPNLRSNGFPSADEHGRRLSLAPGLGAGLRVAPILDSSATVPTATIPPTAPSPPRHSDSLPLLPVTVRHSATRASFQAGDSLAMASAALQHPRGSLSGAAPAVRRAAAVADELVDFLRQGGLEVTVVRQATHLSNVLSSFNSSMNSTTFSTRAAASSSEPLQQVILCPLGDAPTLPSLSLLLSRGTTPSAVCFQQDLVDRARLVEEEWLSNAVATLHHVEQLSNTIPEQEDKDKVDATTTPTTSNTSTAEITVRARPTPIIVAYVTSGTPSPAAMEACVVAGASGILSPPYSAHTAAMVKHLVTFSGNSSIPPTGGISSPSVQPLSSPMNGILEDETKVVLTPTALGLGAEHESEKVLSAFAHQRRRLSTQLNLNRVVSSGSAASADGQNPDRDLQTATSVPSITHSLAAPHSTLSHFPILSQLYDPSGMYAAFESRRRSVDTGRIALAFDRATKRIVPTVKVEASAEPALEDRRESLHMAGDKEQEAADGTNTTQFAEVLGEMYQQTMSSIDIQMSEYDELAAPISREERKRLVNAFSTWDFRPHVLAPGDLYRVACLLFESVLHTEGVVELGLGQEQVNRFLFAVRAIYHAPNPYHNYVHAIDVLQATYHFLQGIGVVPPFEFLLTLEQGKSYWRRPTEETNPCGGHGTRRARHILRPQDVLGVMIAAMGHDVGHPGLSNAFMKNAKVPLSVVYDDKSILENMHCMLIVHLLRKHGFGFLLGPAPAAEAKKYPARADIDSRGFRRVLYGAILATDMALHFAWIQRLKEFAEAMQNEVQVDREALNEEDRAMLCQALIKCADISNPTRPIDVSEHWSTVLLDEWTQQASLEEELALPVSVASGVDARLQAKGQIGFIDLFTHPLFRTTADLIPEMQTYARACDTNRAIWQARLEQLEADADANERRTAALRDLVCAPVSLAQNERFHSLFPLILPPRLTADAPGSAGATPTAAASATATAATPSWATPRSPPQSPARAPASPAVQAVRVVYRDEVHDRSMIARHVLALTGFDPAMGVRRMSTPEVLLVHSRS